MTVTMQIERQSGALVSSVYVADTGHSYELEGLDRIIKQMQVARRWLATDRARKIVK